MIKSMTAFSQGSATDDSITSEVTIRSYNSRYLDVALHIPESCLVFEENIKKIIAGDHERGRIEIKLTIMDEKEDEDLFEVDEKRARQYYRALKKIEKDLKLADGIGMPDILSARNIIVPSKIIPEKHRLWKAVEACVTQASLDLDRMRTKEGENLCADLEQRIGFIEKNMVRLEKEAKKIPGVYKKRLMEKIARLAGETMELDPVRLNQEAAILADKSDVSEEIARLSSHIKMFKEIIGSEKSQGKKLNFLIQEFNREFNTIGSKAGNAVLSHMVVDLKSELEKIREQVQNIE